MILGPLLPNIDDSLEKYNDRIKSEFSRRWSKHRCQVPGCSTVLIFDGGCKVKIIFLNARFNSEAGYGLREIFSAGEKNAKIKVLTLSLDFVVVPESNQLIL